MADITRTEEVDFLDYGYESYHIEFKTENGYKYQRHVWKLMDGSIQEEEWLIRGRE